MKGALLGRSEAIKGKQEKKKIVFHNGLLRVAIYILVRGLPCVLKNETTAGQKDTKSYICAGQVQFISDDLFTVAKFVSSTRRDLWCM
jgi:hypothetical protein